jgi:UDPglucose--hexose-1-phosphate uridylyltransferase
VTGPPAATAASRGAPAEPSSPELRRCPVTGVWVVVAEERLLRPRAPEPPPRPSDRKGCPFCPGHEADTPAEVLVRRDAGSDGWTLRVVPNLFPVLRPDGTSRTREEGLYERREGVGAHEVVIESPRHDQDLGELGVAPVARVLEAVVERMIALARDPRIECVVWFKNHGTAAGATLEHPHSQLIALPVVPGAVREELTRCRERLLAEGRCLVCEMIESEQRDGRRLVAATERHVAFAPYASRFPYETWLLPRAHASSFEAGSGADREDLARMLGDVLARVRRSLDRPAYNLVLHTAPCREPRLDYYHWRLEVLPRRTPLAGFEWGSGVHINPTRPEEAARHLREPVA